MSEWNAWAAGILDGEGCIQLISRKGRTGPRGVGRAGFCLRVDVGNTDPRMLLKLKELFGGSAVSRRKTNRGYGTMPMWQWSLGCAQAEAMLRAVLPWLVVKKEQADLAIISRELVQPSRRKKLTAAELAERQALSDQIKRLKSVCRIDEVACG